MLFGKKEDLGSIVSNLKNAFSEGYQKGYQKGYSDGEKAGLLKKCSPNQLREVFALPPVHDGKRADVVIVDAIVRTETVEATIEVPLTESLEQVKDELLQALSKKLDRYVTYEGEIDPLKNNKTLVAKINIVKEVK